MSGSSQARLLRKTPRALRVLERAAQMSGWGRADPNRAKGPVLQPDNSLSLIEGGLIFGVSMALKERITFSKGRVEQSSFDFSA
jgi:hypothetical protein